MESKKEITIYVEEKWLSGDTCVFNISNYIERLQVKSFISSKRKQFIEKLQKEGFHILFDKKDITEDTIYLIMDPTALCEINVPVEEYKKAFDKKIFESAGKSFNYPFSMSIEKYFDNPFFPAVFKNELTNGGVDKFLIETQEQLEIIKTFYEKNYNSSIYKEAFDNVIIQQYLETPGKYASYLRVLVAGSGDVMGASLKYSARTVGKIDINSLFEKVFLDPNSKYFINAKKMFNYYSGGENISFCQPKYSLEKTQVLSEHGFDVKNLNLPSEVLDVCQNIMENCNKEIGILCGIDFMLNKSDGKWYYLENQAFPAIEEWAQTKGIKIPPCHNIKGYMKYLELEIQARDEALLRLVNKKIQNNEKNKQFVYKK